MIFCHLAIILTWLSQALAATTRTTIADATQVCLDINIGVDMPNPYDCQSYFSCAAVPHLRFCDDGQHFDASNKVCTTPEQAKCKTIDVNATTINMKADDVNTNATSDIDWWFHRPRPVFMAVDILTGQPIDPMAKYDPENIECRHLGAYFLPHPQNCQRYFICAYGHLHQHRCGRGTFWNYKHTECQLSEFATCYSNATTSQQDMETVVPPTTATLPITTTTTANTDDLTSRPITVCYIIDAGEIKHNNTLANELNSAIPIAFAATVPPTPPKPIKPTTSTMAPTVTSTARAQTQTIKCPSERQSYLPDPEDCSKYFICIAGLPVQTICPSGLYWDQQLGYCDFAKNVKCYPNKKKK